MPGVIDVTGWGGKTKTYDITIDQDRLLRYGLTLPQVLQVLNNSNINVGGQTVNFGPQSAVVRGVGLIHSMDDIRNTMLDRAQRHAGAAERRRHGHGRQSAAPRHRRPGRRRRHRPGHRADAARRSRACRPSSASRRRWQKINASGILPPGVHDRAIYDRSDLISVTTHTVLHNMVVGIVLIFLLQWVFLGNLRSALIVAATIPFALCLRDHR